MHSPGGLVDRLGSGRRRFGTRNGLPSAFEHERDPDGQTRSVRPERLTFRLILHVFVCFRCRGAAGRSVQEGQCSGRAGTNRKLSASDLQGAFLPRSELSLHVVSKEAPPVLLAVVDE